MTISNKTNVTLRSDKQVPLTREEMDGNFEELKNVIDDSSNNENKINQLEQDVDDRIQKGSLEEELIKVNEIDDLDNNPLNISRNRITTSTGTQTVAEALDNRVQKGEVGSELAGPTPYLQLTSRLVNDIANGLEITPFHFGAGEPQSGSDDSVRLQDAFEFVLGNLLTPSLNLAGRNWRVKDSIVIRDAPQAARRVHNGRITAESDFIGTYMLDIRPDGNDVAGNRVANFTLDHVAFACGAGSTAYAQGGVIANKLQGFYLERVSFDSFAEYGFNNLTDRAAVELFATLVRASANGAAGVGSAGIRSLGFDSEYRDLLISGAEDGLLFTRSGNIVHDSHIYNCSNSAIKSISSIAMVSGCYIDNCPIILGGLKDSSITSNKFLCASSGTPLANNSFIQLDQSSSSEVRSVSITGNHFNNTTGDLVDSLSFTGTGSIPFVRHFTMSNNGFNNVTPRYSHPKIKSSQISAANTVTVDFSDLIPFGEIKNPTANWLQQSASTATPAAVTKLQAGNTVEVNLSTNATGNALVSATINSEFSD